MANSSILAICVSYLVGSRSLLRERHKIVLPLRAAKSGCPIIYRHYEIIGALSECAGAPHKRSGRCGDLIFVTAWSDRSPVNMARSNLPRAHFPS